MGALRATSGFPSDTPDEVIEQFPKEQEESGARTLQELRARISNREADAYLRGVDAATDRESRSAYNTRSIVLLLVVLAVVSMPIIAMMQGLEPEHSVATSLQSRALRAPSSVTGWGRSAARNFAVRLLPPRPPCRPSGRDPRGAYLPGRPVAR
jgi:hypothetical protein